MAYNKQISQGYQTNNETDLKKKNSLNANGIGDEKTVGDAGTGPSGYGTYKESDAVKQAQAMLKEQVENKPGTYQPAWQTQLDDILKKILNREQFSYDLNGDALYQQYKDQYMLQGQQAMMDTMGQVAALTGGYGNSYAQTAGQQTYQGYIQQLNDKVPELYQLALNKYQMEGDDLMNQYSMIGAREDQDYGRYRDSVSDYYSELDRLTDSYRDERDYDYGKYADDRAYAYQEERDRVADEQWQAEFDEAKRQYDQAYALENGGGSGGSSGNGGSNSGNNSDGNYDTHVYTTEEIKALQDAAGIPADGVWGPQTQKAYEEGYRPASATDYGEGNEATLSTAGENFMKSLPYPHAGSDIETWKQVVDERLERGLNNGTLSEADVMIILSKLDLA